MDDFKNHQNAPLINNHNGLITDRSEFLSFDGKDHVNSRKLLIDMVKNSLLFGADRALLSRKWSPVNGLEEESQLRNGYQSQDGEGMNSEASKVCEREGQNEKVGGKYHLFQSGSKQFNDDTIVCNEDYVEVSKVVNCPSGGYNEFPLNIIAFFAILFLKLIGFQISLFTSFFTLPIWLTYSTFMFILFPFQTLLRIKENLKKRLLGICADLYLSITSSICTRLKAQKKVLNLAIRFGWALLWSIYVCFMLVGLLVLGFILGGLTMRCLVEQPIQTTETLNFDYTKASPTAFVPLVSYPSAGVSSGLISKDSAETVENDGVRAIPYNHKLQLTVSLTLPESEYNRKLGVFQVKVEFLSANSKVTASSSHPTMLRFKSHPIRFVETILKFVPLLAGFQSEAQTLNIKVHDFTEGYEPTACLKVILQQRAEYQPGAGIPQLYAASIALVSELPQFQKFIWHWRRTIFVWLSFVSFLTELVVVLIFFRPPFIPTGRLRAAGAKKGSYRNKISWYKSI